jgi:hypothetical protein
VRHQKFGEGDYKQSEAAVRELLYQAGVHDLPPPMSATAAFPSAGLATPETYLNDQAGRGFAQPLQSGVRYYPGVSSLQLNEFALHGNWWLTGESATPVASGATIRADVQAARVYLVLTSSGNVPRKVGVLLDGRPVSPSAAGADVHGGVVTVRGQRLYSLVSLPQAEDHMLTVEVPPYVSAYDFTFG